MRRWLVVPLLLLAPLAVAQEDAGIREVLRGENATIVFSPGGGYSPQNYLKRFTNSEGQEEWATQEGAAAELIRRAPAGSEIRIGTFRLATSSQVTDAIFAVARGKNVSAKLWLKGPPGLTYMVSGHEQIAARANDYLRQRAAQGKQDEWGDIQVMIGTADQMYAFGKTEDMHEKFGIIGLNPNHTAGSNTAFLGTSNMSSSSDLHHNEHRLFFPNNPKAAQRLWQEFARVWHELGECRTYQDGDSAKGVNFTREPDPVILVDGQPANEGPDDPLLFRFTYEKRGGEFHQIESDFIRAIAQAKELSPGETVWVAQFGFQISSIAQALVQAARENPEVQFKTMVDMKQAQSWQLRQLIDAGLENMQVRVKWDSNKLILDEGRPRIPDHGEPGPSLLHHKSLIVGSRVMITGSYNFFGNADDQGENVVVIRNHVDASYRHLTEDAQAEFSAIWESPVLIDAEKLFGDNGLFSQVGEALEEEDGVFLAVKAALDDELRAPAQIRERVQNAEPSLEETQQVLAMLERFEFASKSAGKFRIRGNSDLIAHAPKAEVRRNATEHNFQGPLKGTVDAGGLELSTPTGVFKVDGNSDVTDLLKYMEGYEVEIFGRVDQGGKTIEVEELRSPKRTAEIPGTLRQDESQDIWLDQDGKSRRVFGPAYWPALHAAGDRISFQGYEFEDGVLALSMWAKVRQDSTLTMGWQPTGQVKRGDKVMVLRSYPDYRLVETEGGARGWLRKDTLEVGVAGMVDAVPVGGETGE